MPSNQFYLICDNIRSLENIGAFFRTADAFGVDTVFVCGISGTPAFAPPTLESYGGHRKATADKPNIAQRDAAGRSTQRAARKIAKTALGAEEWVPWEYHSHTWRLVDKLQKAGCQVAALEQTDQSTPLSEYEPAFPLALVVGNEINGVSPSVRKRADRHVDIPMRGKKESLNVAVAAGIAMYAIAQYR